MNAPNDPNPVENTGAAGRQSTDADMERHTLDERLAQLRAQGIIGGGEGPRSSLRAIAHVPGATARLIERRG